MERALGAIAGLPSNTGGEGGIRTHGDLTATTVFETAPFDHSGTSPRGVHVPPPLTNIIQASPTFAALISAKKPCSKSALSSANTPPVTRQR